MSVKAGERYFLPFFIPQTELLAGTAIEIPVPMDGVIEAVRTSVQVAVTTGGTLTLKSGDALGTTIGSGSLVTTIANSSAKGARQHLVDVNGSGKPDRKVTAGDRLAIVPASFASAGAIYGLVTVRTISLAPAL